MKKANKKGITILLVTIISACIALIMASTFILTSNYNSSIIKKENRLRESLNNDVVFGAKTYIDEDELPTIEIKNKELVKNIGKNYIDSKKSFEKWTIEYIGEEYEESKIYRFNENCELDEDGVYYVTILYSETEETNTYKLTISSKYKLNDDSYSKPAIFKYEDNIAQDE